MRGTMTNMKDVSDRPTYELLPAADYIFEIAEVGDSETRNGDPMVSLVLEVAKGLKKGQRVWDNIVISTNEESPAFKVRWRAKMFLIAIGEPHHGDSFDWDSDRWLFKRCIGTVEHEKQKEGKYAGQMKAVIRKYSPLSDGDKIFTEPAAAAKSEVQDDDIPF